MKCKVIHISATEQTVTETFVESLEDCQKLVGGYIERVCVLENGDELYADEDGLQKDPEYFFSIATLGGFPVFVAGDGYVIGPTDENGDNSDVQYSANAIRSMVSIKKRIQTEGE